MTRPIVPIESTVQFKLLELQAKQASVRRDFFTHHDVRELRSIVQLGRKLFRDRGVVEAGPDEPGILYIGFYLYAYQDHLPNHQRARKLVLRGANHRELVAQAKLLGIVR